MPAGSVRPALSPAHFGGVASTTAAELAAESVAFRSPDMQAANVSGATATENA
jgi:hypothetical protein